jgi:hypothetical protein
MRSLFLITVIFISVSVFGQDHELLKAEIKSKSKLNKSSKAKGYEFVSISARFGKGMENHTKVREEVTAVDYSEDTLIVELSLVANCCASFITELEAVNDKTINFVFEKNDIDCLCLKGIYLTYKIIAPKSEYTFQMNGSTVEQRKIDPNAEREEMEFWDNGNMKSIKMYIGEILHTEHQYDDKGERVKTLIYEGDKIIERTY